MMFPLVRDLAAEGIPVRLTCGVLGFSTQAFYQWHAAPVSDRDWVDAHTINVIIDVHADDPEFGYRFIADELDRAGQPTNERRVWRLCRENRVWSTTAKKGRRTAGKTPGPAVHDDLVERNFTASSLDAVWLTDITEHPTVEGKLYICSIKDVFSNRIVGYALGPRMTAQLAVSALRSAIARRQPEGTVVVHSDRGGQGGFNWSSQHLDRGGVDGDDARASEAGAVVSRADPFARRADGCVAGGSRQVLGGDRARCEDRRRGGGGAGVIPCWLPVVPSRWWREPMLAGNRVGPLSLVL
jgi:hypothetical protein